MFLGRAAEMEQIAQLVDGAREGNGGSVLLVGDPGIGKTTLLNAAIPSLDDLTLIRVTGIEAEANLPYAAMGEAAAPFLGGLEQLPGAQKEAIESALALGNATGQGGERFATFAAFLGLLQISARETPLVLVIDDVQWLDPGSDECFSYAARRLGSSHIAMVAAARTGVRGSLADSDSIDRIEIPGLKTEEAREMLRKLTPDATPSVLRTLLESAAGNPLALRELPAALDENQRKGLAPIERVPAATDAIIGAFTSRLEALDAGSRKAVGVASAAFDRQLVPVVAACRDLEIEIEELEKAERAGVVSIDDTEIRFSHPLLKAVSYDGIPARDRRAAHRALADHSDPDGQAWHLAAGRLGPDREVAEKLDRAALRAIDRGAHNAAADALHRASEFTEDRVTQCQLLYRSALSSALAGDYDRCEALLEISSGVKDPGLRALSFMSLSVIRLSGGMKLPRNAHEELIREAEKVVESLPEIAAVMLADAALLAGTSGQFVAGEVASRRALEVIPGNASLMIRCMVNAMHGMTTAIRGEASEAVAQFEHTGELVEQIDQVSPALQSIVLGLHGQVSSNQEIKLKAQLDRLVAMARQAGATGLLAYLMTVSADVTYRIGDWESCERNSEAVELAAECRQDGILPLALVIRGRLLAARGETDRARADLDRGTGLADTGGALTVTAMGRAGTGFLELGNGRPEEATGQLEQVEAFADDSGFEDPAFIPWASDLIECYVRTGRGKEAEALTTRLGKRAQRAGTALSLAYAARCDGLTRASGFERSFEEALELHRECEAPFERARTLLVFGERLHRARRRVEGRECLRAAQEVFRELEARPWVEQAETELTAAGAIHREAIADRDELSPQEIRVARAVADGATNREVAARMYLSPKTIEFHLGRVYRKLDIHSRAELATLVAKGDFDRKPAAKTALTSDSGTRTGERR